MFAYRLESIEQHEGIHVVRESVWVFWMVSKETVMAEVMRSAQKKEAHGYLFMISRLPNSQTSNINHKNPGLAGKMAAILRFQTMVYYE